jgi:CDP-glucose 4,6-dehydratase
LVELDEAVNWDWWKNKRVLITGITGFLGYRMAKILVDRCEVFGFIKDMDMGSPFYWDSHLTPRVAKTYTGDVRNFFDMERAFIEVKPDVIFNLAAITQVVDSTKLPRQNHEINIMGTVNTFEVVRLHGRGHEIIVTASSDKAFGEIEKMPANEDTPLNPYHPYDASKAAADLIARSYAMYWGMQAAITRCGNIYGIGDLNWQRLIPGTIKAILENNDIVLRSDGKQIREFNYVDDIITAYFLIAQSLDPYAALEEQRSFAGEIYVISDENCVFSVMEVVKTIQKIASLGVVGKSEVKVLGKAKDETEEIILDSSKIHNKLGWKPIVKFEEGLARTVDWIDEYLHTRNSI